MDLLQLNSPQGTEWELLGIVPHDGGIVNSLGEVGLVYLMFVAGLELDLAVFAQYRRQAMAFAVITFALPLAAGAVAALTIGMEGAGGRAPRIAAGVAHPDLLPGGQAARARFEPFVGPLQPDRWGS